MAPTPLSTTDPSPQAVRQTVEQGKLEEALAVLQQCLQRPDVPVTGDDLQGIRTAMKQRGMTAPAADAVYALLSEPETQPVAGEFWALLKFDLSDWDFIKQLRPVFQSNPQVADAATLRWLELLLASGNFRQVLRLASLGEHYLKQRHRLWVAIAEAFVQTGERTRGWFWAADWESHEEATAAELIPVAEILRAQGDFVHPERVNNKGVELEANGPAGSWHRCWLAADDVRAGDDARAAERLRHIDPSGFDAAQRLLHTLVTAAVAVRQATPEDRPNLLAESRQSIDGARAEYPQLTSDPARLAVYRYVLKLLAEHGGAGTRLWAWWRTLRGA